MVNKYCVIGDIHGEFDKLKPLFEKIPKDRLIIFLGDYINKGLKSKEVIDFLIKCNIEFNCKFLLGNHDYYFLQYVEKKLSFAEFAGIGGLGTLKSYLNIAYGDVYKQLIKKLPNSHIEFLLSLQLYYEDDNYFFSHSGINSEKPYSRQKEDLINNFNFFEQKLLINKTIICGHFIQENNKPYISNDLIGIDTGCGVNNGSLTSLLIPEKTYFQYP